MVKKIALVITTISLFVSIFLVGCNKDGLSLDKINEVNSYENLKKNYGTYEIVYDSFYGDENANNYLLIEDGFFISSYEATDLAGIIRYISDDMFFQAKNIEPYAVTRNEFYTYDLDYPDMSDSASVFINADCYEITEKTVTESGYIIEAETINTSQVSDISDYADRTYASGDKVKQIVTLTSELFIEGIEVYYVPVDESGEILSYRIKVSHGDDIERKEYLDTILGKVSNESINVTFVSDDFSYTRKVIKDTEFYFEAYENVYENSEKSAMLVADGCYEDDDDVIINCYKVKLSEDNTYYLQ